MKGINSYASYLEGLNGCEQPSLPWFNKILDLLKHTQTIKTELLYYVQEFEKMIPEKLGDSKISITEPVLDFTFAVKV